MERSNKLEEKPKKTFKIPTRKLCGMAVLTALAIVFACLVRIPYFALPFLEYSPSDVPVLIASFMYGPVAGLIITALVSVIQGVSVSASSGIIGIVMNFLGTGMFVLSAGLVYRFHRTLKGALIGLIVGFVCGVTTMVLWNILFTPIFMGVPRATVLAMIPTAILPFNLLKFAGNAALTFILYKATGKLFNFAFKNVPDKSVVPKKDEIVGSYECASVEETYALAQKIASSLEGGEIILLDGDLGAGKTTFTKGLAKALGISAEVTSPTFTILNVYEDGRLQLNHLDMYRVENADDLAELGVEETIAEGGVTVIEWNKLNNLKGRIIKIHISANDICANEDNAEAASSDAALAQSDSTVRIFEIEEEER